MQAEAIRLRANPHTDRIATSRAGGCPMPGTHARHRLKSDHGASARRLPLPSRRSIPSAQEPDDLVDALVAGEAFLVEEFAHARGASR